MNPLDFIMVVFPLAFLIGILVVLVLFYAGKKERSDKQMDVLKDQLRLGEIDRKTFEKKLASLRQDKTLEDELRELRQLHKDGRIDCDTFLRWWQILIRLKMQGAGYTHVATSDDGAKMKFKRFIEDRVES